MKNKVVILFLCLMMWFLSGCSNGPRPINYGEDACAFCRMTIVDKQHAAQLVTEKGRNYKYDAIECMINHLSKWNKPPVKIRLVADYANPGELTDAIHASYLISEEIPSPMGAFLSAFSSEQQRNHIHSSAGGEKMNWNQLMSALGAEKQDRRH